MILFKNDYEIQGAMRDYSTTNKSALKICTILQKMGILNYDFVLALYQPSLKGIDPHSPDLTLAQKSMIAYECKINIWYFLREVIRVPSQGSDPVPYIFDRANLAATWLFLNSIDVFLTIPRQIGKTTGTACIDSWLMYIIGIGLNIGLFTRNQKLLTQTVTKIKDIRDSLPPYLINHQTSDSNRKEGIAYTALNNQYFAYLAQKSRRAATEQGRGDSTAKQNWDEFGYYDNNHLSYPAATSAISAASEQVRAVGIPCANVILTTAGDLGEKRGHYANEVRKQCMFFNEKIYDVKYISALEEVIDTNSKNNIHMCYLEYSHLQLGKDDAWLKRNTRGKSRDVILRDYHNVWGYASDETFLPVNLSDKLTKHKMEPITCTYYRSLQINWYVHPNIINNNYKYRPFVMGTDTSDNVGEDSTTLVITNPEDMGVIATSKCNQTNLSYIADYIVYLLITYPKSIFIPERNKNGAILLDFILPKLLAKNINPIYRVYNLFIQNYSEYDKIDFSKINWDLGTNRKKLGFTTSGGNRDFLYGTVLMLALEQTADRIFDVNLINEIKGLSVKNGRVDHKNGGHDDLVIAWLLTCFFILYGKNLHMYKIDRSIFLSTIDNIGNKVDAAKKKEQLRIRKQISELKEKLEKCNSTLLQTNYRYMIQDLEERIDKDIVLTENISVDKVQQEAKESKPNIFNNQQKAFNFLKHFY